MKNLLALLILTAAIVFTIPSAAQNETDLESVSMAVERLMDQDKRSSIHQFMEQFMPEQEDRDAYIEKIQGIRKELKGIRDGIGLDIDEAGAILTFSSKDIEKRLRIRYDSGHQQLTDLILLPPEEKLSFDLNNLKAAIQFLKDNDMAGLLYLKDKGEILIKEPFGMANDELGIPNSTATIFAIGSRPIDFTRAAILLLDQKGTLSMEDTIDKHLTNVPADKRSMTLWHLMTGASGLPDFFHDENDWDADLQWVSREEAINRMMAQTLLFEPGTGNSHSHGAFGLLAAIIELKTGQSYLNFLEENFFRVAGMTKTGEYGDKKNFTVSDFAVGGGPQFVGLPNIPPNWGRTSWLIKGSGGMYSTLDDLLNFYTLVRTGEVLDEQHSKYFKEVTANVDGSMRGFELFDYYSPPDSEVYLFLNKTGDPDIRRKTFRALEALID